MDNLPASPLVSGARLSRADVERLVGPVPAVLMDCDLEEADLSGLDLTRLRFERCNLRRCDLSGAHLEGTVWQGCRGPFANFTGAKLSDAAFAGGDFNNCSLRRAVLTSARFVGTKLTGADFTDARAMHIHFEEVLLVSAKLPCFSFRKETLRRVDFSGADLRKGDFRMVDGKTVKNEAGYTETHAEFHRVTAWGGLGTSIVKHKKKGDLLEVQGRLHYSKWTDRDGVERYAVEIIAEEALFL